MKTVAIIAILFTAAIFNSVSAQVKIAPKAVQVRSVTVTTQPDASVWLDGVLFGKADRAGNLAIKSVSAGVHTLRVRADGFKEKLQPVAAIHKGEIKVALVKTTDEAELAFQEAERLTTTDRAKAIIAYQRAIKLRPNYPESFLSLARTQAELGDLDDAQKSINSARKLRPGYAEASAVEGRILKEKGEEDKAIASFKRAVTEGKGFQPEALTGLGLLYKERAEGFGGSGNFDEEQLNLTESAKYLKSAIKQLSGAPDALVVYQILGLIYERQQKFADAIATYEEFLRLFPDTAEASAVRSFITQLRKQLDGQ